MLSCQSNGEKQDEGFLFVFFFFNSGYSCSAASFGPANLTDRCTQIALNCGTCMELIMVLRANTVAESLSVDWLSNVPCVSISNTATCVIRHEKKLTRLCVWMFSMVTDVEKNPPKPSNKFVFSCSSKISMENFRKFNVFHGEKLSYPNSSGKV